MVDQLFRSFPGLEAVIQATGIKVFNGTAMHKTVLLGGSVDNTLLSFISTQATLWLSI